MNNRKDSLLLYGGVVQYRHYHRDPQIPSTRNQEGGDLQINHSGRTKRISKGSTYYFQLAPGLKRPRKLKEAFERRNKPYSILYKHLL